MRQLLPFCILLYLLSSCTAKRQNDKTAFNDIPVSALSGKELSIAHCSRCHAFVSPDLLPKTNWRDVLPAMGHRMGIYSGGLRPDSLFDTGASGSVVRDANIFPERPILAKDDWHKIEKYYLENAPDTILPPLRKNPIRIGLEHFNYKETAFSHRPSLTTLVKILPDNRGVVFGDGKSRRNVLTLLTPDLHENFSLRLEATPIQLYEESNEVYLTTIGKGVFPTDASNGAMQRLVKNSLGPGYKLENTAIPDLRRPVFMAYGDLNKDGFKDVVACEFGNQTGQLAWYEITEKGIIPKGFCVRNPAR